MDYKYSSLLQQPDNSDSDIQIIEVSKPKVNKRKGNEATQTISKRKSVKLAQSVKPGSQIFLFPAIDLDIFYIKDPRQMLNFLRGVWDESKLLKRFHFTLILEEKNKKSDGQRIVCTADKCGYFIKFTKSRSKLQYKIQAINYWHNHRTIRIKPNYLNQKSNNRGLQARRQVQKLLDIYGSHFVKQLLKKSIAENRAYPPFSKLQIKTDNYFIRQYFSTLQSQKTIMGLQKKAIEIIQQPFKDDIKPSYLKLKTEIVKDAIIEHNRDVFNVQAQNQEQQILTEVILYVSSNMLQNFKKWGKSLYIGQLQGAYYGPDIDVKSDLEAIDNDLAKYIFCGTDHQLNIVIFGIGLIHGPKKHILNKYDKLKDLPKQLKTELMTLFMKKVPNFSDCQSIFLKQQHVQLLQILENLKQQHKNKYIIKYKIQSWQHITDHHKNPYQCQKSGIIPEIVYLQYYRNFSKSQIDKNLCQTTNQTQEDMPISNNTRNSKNKNKKNRKQNVLLHAQKIRKYPVMSVRFYNKKSLRLVDILLRRVCYALHLSNFSKAHNQLLGWFKHDQVYQLFTSKFYPNLRYYTLRQFGQKQTNIGFIGSNLLVNFQYWFKKQKRDYFRIQYDNYFQYRKNPMFKKEYTNISFHPQPTISKQSYNFGYQRWYEPQLPDKNSKKQSYQKGIVQETLRNLILIYCQNKSKFAIDQNYLQNIGFNSSIEETASSNYEEIKKKIKFKTNKIIYNKEHRNYFQYFLENLNVDGEQYRQTMKKFQKLPYYNLTKLYLSRQTQHLLLGYQLLNILSFNCYELFQREAVWNQKNIAVSSLKSGYNDHSVNLFKVENQTLEEKQDDTVEDIRLFYVGNSQGQGRVKMIKYKYDQNDKLYTSHHIRNSQSYIKWQCDCLFTNYMGIPCRHILKVIMTTDSNILSGFDNFWLKSDLEQKKNSRKSKNTQLWSGFGQANREEDQLTLQTINNPENNLSYFYQYNPISKKYEYKYLYDHENPLTTSKNQQFEEWLARIVSKGTKRDRSGLRKQKMYNFFSAKQSV